MLECFYQGADIKWIWVDVNKNPLIPGTNKRDKFKPLTQHDMMWLIANFLDYIVIF